MRTRAEHETIIRWDDDEQIVNVYSASPKVLRLIKKRFGLTPARTFLDKDGNLTGADFHVPLSEFRWGMKARRKPLSELERVKRADHMRQIRRPWSGAEVTPLGSEKKGAGGWPSLQPDQRGRENVRAAD